MIVTIRPANSGWFNAYTYKPWASFELLDGSGASLTGGLPITCEYQRTVIDAARQSSGAIDSLGTYTGGRSSNPIVCEFGSAKADFLHGSLTGYIPFNGQERLILVTDAALTAGSYEVRIEYLAAARININGGRISVLPS